MAIVGLISCAAPEKMIYFQHDESGSNKNPDIRQLVRLKPGDLLEITVSSLDVEAATPFNLSALNPGGSGGNTQGKESVGFLIDSKGTIEFPVIGSVEVGGKTRIEAMNYLKGLLVPYLNDAIVNIRIANFRITVLGEVNRPGTYVVESDNLTLPQAIGLAGDLAITGIRTNVLVIREIEGQETFTHVNLTSKDLFKSPVYYLHQNDIVYVEPNRSRLNASAINPSITLGLSVVSILLQIAIILIVR